MSFFWSLYLNNNNVSNIETLDNSNFVISILLSALLFDEDIVNGKDMESLHTGPEDATVKGVGSEQTQRYIVRKPRSLSNRFGLRSP